MSRFDYYFLYTCYILWVVGAIYNLIDAFIHRYEDDGDRFKYGFFILAATPVAPLMIIIGAVLGGFVLLFAVIPELIYEGLKKLFKK